MQRKKELFFCGRSTTLIVDGTPLEKDKFSMNTSRHQQELRHGLSISKRLA